MINKGAAQREEEGGYIKAERERGAVLRIRLEVITNAVSGERCSVAIWSSSIQNLIYQDNIVLGVFTLLSFSLL